MINNSLHFWGYGGPPASVKCFAYFMKPFKRLTADKTPATNFSVTKTSDCKAFKIPHSITAMDTTAITRITSKIVNRVVMDYLLTL
jgi:hypothetical protein